MTTEGFEPSNHEGRDLKSPAFDHFAMSSFFTTFAQF